eukprot:TRINITY_DN13597_c0_g1_i1.p1 TRINITY_DN13597_c0_g1~~TRINITY_DN13597_c0_g1_i1.p1  ORF type:complete len:700 (+),score=123.26 TRINITY_DN13597_c0_g1_i1:113-2212(+)
MTHEYLRPGSIVAVCGSNNEVWLAEVKYDGGEKVPFIRWLACDPTADRDYVWCVGLDHLDRSALLDKDVTFERRQRRLPLDESQRLQALRAAHPAFPVSRTGPKTKAPDKSRRVAKPAAKKSAARPAPPPPSPQPPAPAGAGELQPGTAVKEVRLKGNTRYTKQGAVMCSVGDGKYRVKWAGLLSGKMYTKPRIEVHALEELEVLTATPAPTPAPTAGQELRAARTEAVESSDSSSLSESTEKTPASPAAVVEPAKGAPPGLEPKGKMKGEPGGDANGEAQGKPKEEAEGGAKLEQRPGERAEAAPPAERATVQEAPSAAAMKSQTMTASSPLRRPDPPASHVSQPHKPDASQLAQKRVRSEASVQSRGSAPPKRQKQECQAKKPSGKRVAAKTGGKITKVAPKKAVGTAPPSMIGSSEHSYAELIVLSSASGAVAKKEKAAPLTIADHVQQIGYEHLREVEAHRRIMRAKVERWLSGVEPPAEGVPQAPLPSKEAPMPRGEKREELWLLNWPQGMEGKRVVAAAEGLLREWDREVKSEMKGGMWTLLFVGSCTPQDLRWFASELMEQLPGLAVVPVLRENRGYEVAHRRRCHEKVPYANSLLIEGVATFPLYTYPIGLVRAAAQDAGAPLELVVLNFSSSATAAHENFTVVVAFRLSEDCDRRAVCESRAARLKSEYPLARIYIAGDVKPLGTFSTSR